MLTCVDKSVSPVTHISAHVNVTRNNVEALKVLVPTTRELSNTYMSAVESLFRNGCVPLPQVAIRRHAPTVVIIDASPKSFIFYKKGVIHDERWYVSHSRWL